MVAESIRGHVGSRRRLLMAEVDVPFPLDSRFVQQAEQKLGRVSAASDTLQ
jgi:hypothetical protein